VVKFKVIDGDGGGDYDTIGHVETTIGKIMGSKAQTFQAEIMNDNKKSGQLIVRAEAIQESNLALAYSVRWTNVNNTIAGCMGLCNETVRYCMEIQREIKG